MTPDVPHFPDAACASVGSDVFYADETQRSYNLIAKRICAGCPDRLPCGTWATDTLEPFGIWGGMTARERQEARRGRPRTERQARTEKARGAAENVSRDRAEQARQLRAQGKTFAAIAHALDVHERTVARYLAKDVA